MSDDDIIEGEAREVEEEAVPERALTVTAPQSSVIVGGIAALARMSDETFEENLAALGKVRERVDRVKKALMKDGVDYGPPFKGSQKDVLLKPGTETLLRAFGLADSYRIEQERGDGEHEPDLAVTAYARIHIGDTSGPVIAEGVGAANTWETKHRYRGQEGRTCPDCGQATVIPSRYGGWWCGPRDGGCGHNFPADDPRLTSQTVGKAENPDPWDLANTVVKMAKKRAMVDGVLTATGTSGLFSQDEDAPGGPDAGGNGAQPASSGPSSPAAGQSGQGRQSSPSAAPGASTAGRDEEPLPAGTIQAVIDATPEANVRMVRSAHKERRWEGERPKLELVTKVGNRKHTGILLGPLAEAAAMAQIKVGEAVRFVGAVVEEIEWQTGKPPRKEIWGAPAAGYLMRDLLVMRDGSWWSVNSAMPTLLPTADAPAVEPATASTASSSTSTSTPSPATTTAPSEPPARMHGTTGEWGAFRGVLVDPIQFTVRGTTPVAILRVAEADTGQIVFAALGKEIEEQVGTEGKPFMVPGDTVTLYGEWKGDWLVVDTAGKAA